MTDKALSVTAALLGLLLLTGCSGSSISPTSPGGGGGLTGPDPTALSVSATTAGGLTATLAQDHATIATNGTVTYTLTLTNGTQTAVTVQAAQLNGQAAPPAAFQLADGSGHVLYATQPTATSPLTLQPGALVSETLTLTGYLQTEARYTATATLTVAGTSTSVGPLVITARQGYIVH